MLSGYLEHFHLEAEQARPAHRARRQEIMKHLSLASRYRPQTFAQVAGQDMVKAVLSRAAAEDRPAAAYLLSGTRGVGKTTIARIFAKALNCEHSPGPEPCNECAQCRKITQGVHVDVTEIDGASNNSVEDARSLRETIGYAAMEGRYKVFIIDEAHMLTRNAFNALLKTLEEPPERVVFIFATTEAHKFPVTIVSRCQHFVFRHLSEDALVEHLSGVLHKENVTFEDSAVRLLARRAAGSVRDSMSLLDQTLALGGEQLTAAATRQVLGLAGQDMFAGLFEALHAQDCPAVAELCRQILQQGVDIGFFVRELAGNLRNLFLLRQGGAAVAPSLQLPADEAALWQSLAPRFSTAHLHAAWQMTLDAQRGIVQSPEPAAALELLLLNLALLPQLLPVGQVTPGQMPAGSAGAAGTGQPSSTATPASASGHASGAQHSGPRAGQPPHAGAETPRNSGGTQDDLPSTSGMSKSAARSRDASTAARPATDGEEAETSDPAPSYSAHSRNQPGGHDENGVLPRNGGQRNAEGSARDSGHDIDPGHAQHEDAGASSYSARRATAASGFSPSQDAPGNGASASLPHSEAPGPDMDSAPWTGQDEDYAPYEDDALTESPAQRQWAGRSNAARSQDGSGQHAGQNAGPDNGHAGEAESGQQHPQDGQTCQTPRHSARPRQAPEAVRGSAPGRSHNWQDFYDFCVTEQAASRPVPAPYVLRGIGVDWQGSTLRLQPRTQTQLHQLEKQANALYAALAAYGAPETQIEIIAPRPHRPEADLIAEFSRKEELQPCFEVLKASLKGCRPLE